MKLPKKQKKNQNSRFWFWWRLNSRDGVGITFGVVVTLKEINGVNRIEDFIQ